MASTCQLHYNVPRTCQVHNGVASTCQVHNDVASTFQLHNGVASTIQVNNDVASITTQIKVTEDLLKLPPPTALTKVNVISSFSQDTANFSPSGPWTGISMHVTGPDATAAIATTIPEQHGVANITVSAAARETLHCQVTAASIPLYCTDAPMVSEME